MSGVSLCAGRMARRAAANAGARAAQAHSFFSSSISISFCLPVDGLAMLSCRAQAPRQAGAWGRRAADEAVRRTFMAQGLGALRLPTGLGSSPCPWNVHTCGVQCSYTTTVFRRTASGRTAGVTATAASSSCPWNVHKAATRQETRVNS